MGERSSAGGADVIEAQALLTEAGQQLGVLGFRFGQLNPRHAEPGERSAASSARLFTAAGSAGETRQALRLAVAWRHVPKEDAQPAVKLVSRLIAIPWKMTRG